MKTNRVGTHATTIATYDGYTSVTYHHTAVVRFNAVEVILNSGGYLSHTTKARMNQAANQYGLGFGVYQEKKRWFVQYKGETIPFTDGMILDR